jgi:hypothetical protein
MTVFEKVVMFRRVFGKHQHGSSGLFGGSDNVWQLAAAVVRKV